MRVVLDTNVLVSGLLTPNGPPGRIVDGLLLGELVPVFDDRILREYAVVLARPRFRFDPVRIAAVLAYLEHAGEPVMAPPLSLELPDPADGAFLEVAWHADVHALVTGNLRHFPSEACGAVRVEAPGPFVQRWASLRVR